MPFQKASQLVSTPTGSRRAWTPPVPATSRMWSLWADGEYAHLPCPPFLLPSQPCFPLRKMEELMCATLRTYRHRFMNKNLPIFYGPAYQHVRNATSISSSLQPRLTTLPPPSPCSPRPFLCNPTQPPMFWPLTAHPPLLLYPTRSSHCTRTSRSIRLPPNYHLSPESRQYPSKISSTRLATCVCYTIQRSVGHVALVESCSSVLAE